MLYLHCTVKNHMQPVHLHFTFFCTVKNNMKPVHLQLKTNTLGFACQCAAGFTGLTCMETVDPCASAPCQNGATCRSTGNQVKHGALNIIFFLI